jgi:hypothetical protein
MTETVLSFEQAIAQTQDLLERHRRGEILTEQLAFSIAQLVTTSNGARGFFVIWLTEENPLAGVTPPEILDALRKSPDLVAELLTKNLAMSTAMAYTHRINGDLASAQGSEQVSKRTQALIKHLHLPSVDEQLILLKTSLQSQEGHYMAFLQRWGYDSAQQEAIHSVLETITG